MPWLVEGEKLLTDLIPEDGQVLLIEPRRMRDRAGDILAEEADLATHLARTTWDVPDGVDIPHLHLRLRPAARPHRGAGLDDDGHAGQPRGHDRPVDRLEPGGRRRRGARQPARQADRRRVPGRRRRRHRGVGRPHRRAAPRPRPRPRRGGRPARAGLHPARRQAGRAGRARPHRPAPRPPGTAAPPHRRRRLLRRPQARRPRRAPPARRRPLRRDGHARHRRRGARLPPARTTGATTSSTSRPTRSTRSATTPAATRRRLSKLGGSRLAEDEGPGPLRGAAHRAGARRALPEAAAHPRPRVPRGHRVAARAGGRLPVPGDARPAQGDRRREGGHGGDDPDGPPGVRRRRLRQDRGRHPGRVQGGPGRQAGGGARAHHAARAAALPDLRRPLRGLPGPGRGAVPLPHHRPGQAGGRGRAHRARSTA